MTRALAASLVVLALTGGGGCGYTLAARPDLPGGVQAVEVPVVQADLPDVEVGAVFGRALAARALADDRLTRDGSGARLLARVTGITVTPAAFPGNVAGAGLYTLGLRVVLRLVPRGGGKPLRQVVVSGDVPYLAGRGPEATEANRRRALTRLSRRLASRAWAQLTGPAPEPPPKPTSKPSPASKP